MFKLIRVDNADHTEIPVPVGVHCFGRGVFLDCHDKRVSRQHGKLEVVGNTVTLTALHSNPCFVMTSSTTTKQVLKSGARVTLAADARFGLLPDSYWYRLEAGPPPAHPAHPADTNAEVAKNDVLDFPFDEEMSQTAGGPVSISLLGNDKTQVIQKERVEERSSTECADEARPATPDPGAAPRPPSAAEAPPPVPAAAKRALAPSADTPAPPDKQSRTASEERDVKPSASQLAAAAATPSAGEEAADGEHCKADVKKERASSPPPAPAPARERCFYGASCYRRNPQHRRDYSHPRDADWGAGALGVCPWGAACARREPRHWAVHAHPPGTAPPAAPHRGPPSTVVRRGATFYISAHAVHFHDDHFRVEDEDGDGVDYDYEF